MNRMCPSLMKYHLKVGFPANATFRKKVRKFSVALREIFLRKNAKIFSQNTKCENFAKMRKFCDSHECYNCNN